MRDDVDRALLDRFVQGDQDAFEWLFRHFQGEVHRWILRIVRDASAADGVLVEAFWRAYRGRFFAMGRPMSPSPMNPTVSAMRGSIVPAELRIADSRNHLWS
jgi:hypothetical protein